MADLRFYQSPPGENQHPADGTASDKYNIDQSTKNIDTDDFKVHEPLQDHGLWTCTKTGWLSRPTSDDEDPALDDFAILLSPGEDVIVNMELFHKLPFKPGRYIYVGKLKHEVEPATAEHPETEVYAGYQIPMPTKQDPAAQLTIMGETDMQFFMEENIFGDDWTSFNVKALLTNDKLPLVEPNYSGHARPLMWIGVGDDLEKSLFRLRHAGDPEHPDPNSGYLATRDEARTPDSV
ncbi:hypothetical protein H2200_006454 [Cladophialophora chaetospira]|uniref:Uncharacterized protein n=1 Tax=Cladophialophora chaetospira TaxID=386627 RepID=A0AA39CHQ9_9EURO|nr:hypothetical protein H2200_006454 [Cladophialophora chaetospira]